MDMGIHPGCAKTLREKIFSAMNESLTIEDFRHFIANPINESLILCLRQDPCPLMQKHGFGTYDEGWSIACKYCNLNAKEGIMWSDENCGGSSCYRHYLKMIGSYQLQYNGRAFTDNQIADALLKFIEYVAIYDNKSIDP